MADRYNFRSQPDLDGNAYAALPGTQPGAFVPNNLTLKKANLAPGRAIPGCHPSRWIYELLHNDFTACDIFERARRADLDVPYAWEHEHKLVVNGKQGFSTASARLFSAICLDCHFHFVFKMSWDEKCVASLCQHEQSRWPLPDTQFPWHHLVWAGSDAQPNIERDRTSYYPLLARETFICSASPCTFEITLEVSQPRMPGGWINLLQDHETIRKQLQTAKNQEPTRYEAATDDWAYQAPLNLNTYLKNLLESSPEDVRSISKRNKRFAVLFGPRCFSMFEGLGFSEQVQFVDGIDEGSFTPTAPPPPSGPSESTEVGTYRGYLEDVRAEVQCLIHKAGQPAERPSFCIQALHDELGCQEVPNVSENALVGADRYKLLGVLPYQPKEVVVNAYKRQWDLLFSRRRDLVEALMGIANDLGNEQLSDYAMTQSSVFESQLQRQSTNDDDGLISQALTFLGLAPPNNYDAEDLIKAFRQKLAREPGEASTARSMLLVIAQASTNDTFQAMLLMEADAKMSMTTSKIVLGLEDASGFGPEALESARSKIEAGKSKEEKATYLDALSTIAEHTMSTDLKREVAELQQQNGLSPQTGIITSDVANDTVNYELPVGLENIGNTCYLNSLLQYLFTVKPVRDIALHYDDFRLELTDESIKNRLIGGNKMQMDRGEAVVAQAFAQELSKLFQNLLSSDRAATRPSQRLANAVLLSTHTLLKDPKPAAETTTTAEPPPLPARPSPAPPTHSNEDVDMVNVSINPISDSFESGSNISSQTLVDQGDADSDRSYEKIETSTRGSDTQLIDLTAEKDQPDASMVDTEDMEGKDSQKSITEGLANADIKMDDAEGPQTVDQKVLTALEHQERSSGTDQQDVEEVMGSIINRLQAAINPSSADQSTGIQIEKIMETFFVTTVNYTKKFDQPNYQREISFDRSITAFPAPEGACSLYDALARNFDQQIIEESRLSRYTTIKTLPPVLHVLIQRTQSLGSKNRNAVDIPETLYLDRFLDADHDSPEFKERAKYWVIKDRQADLERLKVKINTAGPLGLLTNSFGEESSEAKPEIEESTVVDDMEENWDFDGPLDDDFMLVKAPQEEEVGVPILPDKPEGIEEAELAVREMMDAEIRHREEDMDRYFAGLTKVPYRLHAVICHSGDLRAGHYWVWIHDFERNLWHKYNDSNVEANKNTEEVLALLGQSGEPYYLAYVRDDENKHDYVDVPRRQAPPQQPEADVGGDVDADGDICVLPDTAGSAGDN